MIAVAVIGAGAAALVKPNRAWALVLLALFQIALLTAILGLLLRRGPRRTWWVGFALFGWAYLIPAFFLPDEYRLILPRDHLVYAAQAMLVFEIVPALGDRETMATLITEMPGALAQVDNQSRIIVAYSLMGLLFAGLGGLIARWFSRDEPASTG
jgi:hypothetical protein